MNLNEDDGRAEILDRLANQSGLLNSSLAAGNNLGISHMFYFGDSLSDSHLLYEQGGVGTWDNYDYAGRATNGLVHAQIAPYLLGIETVKDHNFAVNGSRALAELETDGSFDSSFDSQINSFMAAGYDRAMLADSAATVYIGLNDFSDTLQTTILGGADNLRDAATALVDDLLVKVETQSRALIDAGFGTLILNGLQTGEAISLIKIANDLISGGAQVVDGLLEALGFNDLLGFFGVDFSLTDYFGGEDFLRTFGEEIITRYNAGLEDLSNRLAEETNVETRYVDMDGLFDAVQADGASFGFTNTAVSWLTVPQIGDLLDGAVAGLARNPLSFGHDLDGLMWYDPIHPTAKMHKIMAVYQATTLKADRTEFMGDSSDFLYSRAGDDLIFADGGNDRVYTSGGDDVVFGGKGNDLISGGWGNDIVAGGTGDDRVYGGSSHDVVFGHDGKDRLFGGAGDDLLQGGKGLDKMYGGSGDDTFIFENAEDVPRWWEWWKDKSHETIHGGSGEDTLYLFFDSSHLRDKLVDDLRDGPNSSGAIKFNDIRLTVYDVENIVIKKGDPAAIGLGNTILQANADAAELWSII